MVRSGGPGGLWRGTSAGRRARMLGGCAGAEARRRACRRRWRWQARSRCWRRPRRRRGRRRSGRAVG
ncbi:hypothetical protein EII42_06630 [Tessaracoccus sp. OH4464_COT-324]|nr:hypothetical protein EII42_06630 [Tessaracoccus sp. OH4464_COT-324]